MQKIFTLVVFLLSAFTAWAQNATVQGVVLDRSGATLPGAQVVLKSAKTQQEQGTTSDANGAFRFPVVAHGATELRVVRTGFATTSRTLQIPGPDLQALQVILDTETVRQQVQVSATTELLATDRSAQIRTLTTQQIENLPAASRNYTHLIVGSAGVAAPLPDRTGRGLNLATAPGSQADDATQSLNPSVNGARPTNNSLMINGVDATNMMSGSGSLGNNINVPLDALEAVEMQTALYSASTGRNGGANIQMITRSGTNDFHGSIAHFLQNDKLNANEFFLNRAGTARPKFRRNESYAGFGGPIIRNRTFFFGAIQRTDFTTGFAARAIASTSIPVGLTDTRTPESIAGVANQWLQSGAQDNPEFAANFLTAVRAFPPEQVAGLERRFFTDISNPRAPVFRQLTAADIHPVAINILNQRRNGNLLLPSASQGTILWPGNGTFGSEIQLTQAFPTVYNSWSGSGTIEHIVSTNDRLRLNYIKATQVVEEAFGWANSSPSPTQGLSPAYVASLSYVRTISPTWINDLRGGFFELFNTRISKFRDIKNSTLGIYNPLEFSVGGLAALMPTIDISAQRGGAGIGNAWDFFDRQRNAYLTNTVTNILGSHSVQFGTEIRRTTLAGEYMARTNGDLDYNNWVFFFTGNGASGGGSDLDQGDTRRNYRTWDTSLFVQDDWKVARNFTINAGIRWDYFGWFRELKGRIGTFFTQEMAQRAGVQPGYHVASDHLIFQPNFNPLQMGLYVSPEVPLDLSMVHQAERKTIFRPDRNNFAPRFGFAYQPGIKGMVLRGGYGVYYERPSGAFKTDLQLSAPFFIYQNVPSPPDMANPYPEININPFQIPLGVQISRAANGTPTWRRFDGTAFPSTEPFNPKSYTVIDPFIDTPYTQQWSFNVQYEPFSGNLFDIKYVGTRGVGLFAKLNIAQALDPRVTPVNGFTDIRNSAGTLIDPNFFVPSEFLGLNRSGGFNLLSNWGNSTYHAFQFEYRRRFQKNLLVNAAYTWGKTIDNVSTNSGVVQHDARRADNNRAVADFDRTHRFTVQYVYQLPTPSRQRFAKALLGDWGLNGMVTFQSGTPFSITGDSSVNAIFARVGTTRVSFAPGKTLEDARRGGPPQNRIDRFYNPDVFVNSPDAWGNTGRNILRGPVQRQFDFSLAKTAKFTEQVGAEFRWEVFNAFNQPTFSNPVSALPTSGYGAMGAITGTIGGPRTMQFATRIRF